METIPKQKLMPKTVKKLNIIEIPIAKQYKATEKDFNAMKCNNFLFLGIMIIFSMPLKILIK